MLCAHCAYTASGIPNYWRRNGIGCGYIVWLFELKNVHPFAPFRIRSRQNYSHSLVSIGTEDNKPFEPAISVIVLLARFKNKN